jgi:prolyl-tRNA synthetase
MSHEFIILADTGESAVFCDRRWVEWDVLASAPAYDQDLEPFFADATGIYAATEEKHNPDTCPLPAEQLVTARGIEVGHIFYFGTKYSKPLGAVVAGPDGNPVTLEMGSYGIGVSRLVAAVIEASHDDAGIIWPESVAPFKVGLINLKSGDAACDKVCADLYDVLRTAQVEVLYDDREERPGVKFADMDLIGLPWQLVVGPRGLKAGTVELKNRATGERLELSQDSALERLTS